MYIYIYDLLGLSSEEVKTPKFSAFLFFLFSTFSFYPFFFSLNYIYFPILLGYSTILGFLTNLVPNYISLITNLVLIIKYNINIEDGMIEDNN